jgi:hypothetical protein
MQDARQQTRESAGWPGCLCLTSKGTLLYISRASGASGKVMVAVGAPCAWGMPCQANLGCAADATGIDTTSPPSHGVFEMV